MEDGAEAGYGSVISMLPSRVDLCETLFAVFTIVLARENRKLFLYKSESHVNLPHKLSITSQLVIGELTG